MFYTPNENEDDRTVAINLKLKEQYSKELEINLRQAIAGDKIVDEESVNIELMEYTAKNGKSSINLKDLQNVLDEIAKKNDYEVGGNFTDNVRNTVQKNIVNIVEGKESSISKDAIRSEILQKVEKALNNNNWDETTAQNEIEMAVTKDVSEEVIQHLSASELTSIITSAINSKGSLNKKTVNPEFEPIVNSASRIADMNKDAAELLGQEYDTEELINAILNKDITD